MLTTDSFKDKARYLLARLLVRKTGKWYRVDQLKYVAELGAEGIVEAMKELCGTLSSNGGSQRSVSSQLSQTPAREEKVENANVVDLISNDEDGRREAAERAESKQTVVSCSTSTSQSDDEQKLRTKSLDNRNLLDYYAEDESRASLSDLLKCLTVEELKNLAKTLKLSSALTTVCDDAS